MTTETLLELARTCLKYGRVNRATFHEDGVTPESDTTHTVMLGVIACALCPDEWDRGKVAQYVIVHDLPEWLDGDVNSFDISDEDKVAKDVLEEKARQRLAEMFGKTAPWVVETLEAYEKQFDFESRFVRVLDKALPKYTHALNGCTSIKKMGKTKIDLRRAHRKQLADLTRDYPEQQLALGVLQESMRLAEDAWGG